MFSINYGSTNYCWSNIVSRISRPGKGRKETLGTKMSYADGRHYQHQQLPTSLRWLSHIATIMIIYNGWHLSYHVAIIIISTAPIAITNIVHFCPSHCDTACTRVTERELRTRLTVLTYKTTTPPTTKPFYCRMFFGCESRDSLSNHRNSDLENNMLGQEPITRSVQLP